MSWLGSHARAMRLDGEAAGWGALILTLLAAGVAFTAFWRHAAKRPQQRLRWDGTGWQLLTGDAAEALGTPTIRIDLGHALLLRARGPSHRPVWLALECRDAPTSWHRLRVVLSQPLRSAQPVSQPDGVMA
jgi:hypothetical protein